MNRQCVDIINKHEPHKLLYSGAFTASFAQFVFATTTNITTEQSEEEYRVTHMYGDGGGAVAVVAATAISY